MTREEAIDLLSMIEFENAECNLGTWYHGIDGDMKKALEMAIKALEQEPQFYPQCEDCNKKMDEIRMVYDKCKEQEPCDDIKEIREVMSCDANSETKCKMISNILTAKPHYFKEKEPCDDAISRQAVLKQLKGCLTGGETEYSYAKIHIDNIPPVTPQPKTGHWIYKTVRGEEVPCCSRCGLDNGTYYEFNFCPECGANMSEG